VTAEEIGAMPRERFVETVGFAFEHSPWVAERAWGRRPFATLGALHAALTAEVQCAAREEQLALLRAHPDLGARARMSAASEGEQAGAGLDRLTRDEFERLHTFNAEYREKFGFPFLFAVKSATKHDILKALEQRLNAAPELEFEEALRQVYRIARFRLETVVESAKGARLRQFATGWKRNYYGKADVIVYRLHRAGNEPADQCPVFGASVTMLLYGEAFWPTYTTGDNTGLVATDSMKNFIQRESLNYSASGLEGYCHFLAEKFMKTYPHTEGMQVSATGIPYDGIGSGTVAFAPKGPDRAFASVELTQSGIVDVQSGIRGFKLLRLGGSAFAGFLRDEYTTLPDVQNRPLHMWLDLDWRYSDSAAAFDGGTAAHVRRLVHEVFHGFESGSIQQVIYQIGTRMLEEMPAVAEVNLEANNRTWDTVVEQGGEVGVFTEARPPYGVLGLSLRR
jgi:urate oxidase / 2-oxo-4-hydroxy-4-carboxy-5-ureidoimidazoline decarboxylase